MQLGIWPSQLSSKLQSTASSPLQLCHFPHGHRSRKAGIISHHTVLSQSSTCIIGNDSPNSSRLLPEHPLCWRKTIVGGVSIHSFQSRNQTAPHIFRDHVQQLWWCHWHRSSLATATVPHAPQLWWCLRHLKLPPHEVTICLTHRMSGQMTIIPKPSDRPAINSSGDMSVSRLLTK